MRDTLQRPHTFLDVAESSCQLEEFGRHLRDWQHEIRRGAVGSCSAFAERLADALPLLAERFDGGDLADAMLAAYAEWLADQAGIPRPGWCAGPGRVAVQPWFGSPLRGWLLAHTPASFRQRNLFTIPEPVFTPRAGRPRKSPEHKALMAAKRQREYRRRIRCLVEQARQAHKD